jgi:hypothetical protein
MKASAALAAITAALTLAASNLSHTIASGKRIPRLTRSTRRRSYNKPIHNTQEIEAHNAKIEAKRREKLARKGKLK